MPASNGQSETASEQKLIESEDTEMRYLVKKSDGWIHIDARSPAGPKSNDSVGIRLVDAPDVLDALRDVVQP